MAESGGPRVKLWAWLEEVGNVLRRQEGQTLVEYALMIGVISIATIFAMQALGPSIGNAFQAVTGVIEEYSPL